MLQSMPKSGGWLNSVKVVLGFLELALALNGKKRKLKKDDFIAAMQKSMLNDKVIHNILNKFDKYVLKWFDLIDISFLPDEMKMKYKELIACKINKLH
jgi:serine/threonine-protein kinase HipA